MKNHYDLLTSRFSNLVIPSVIVNIALVLVLTFLSIMIVNKASNNEIVKKLKVVKTENNIENNVQIVDLKLPIVLKQLSYTKSYFKFESSFERYETTTNNEISIIVDRIQNKSPYITSSRFTSEFSGFSSLESLVTPVVNDKFEGTIYNKKINNQHFVRTYSPYKPGCAVKLMYETVILDDTGEYVYYIEINSGWEDVCQLESDQYSVAMSNPDVWFKNHPSEKFDLLDQFIRENFK